MSRRSMGDWAVVSLGCGQLSESPGQPVRFSAVGPVQLWNLTSALLVLPREDDRPKVKALVGRRRCCLTSRIGARLRLKPSH